MDPFDPRDRFDGEKAKAHVERKDHHCYREKIDMRDGTTVDAFICGAFGPPCACGAISTVLCDFPIGEEARTCDRPCCERCAPTLGRDKNFCPEHIAQGAGENMLLFKPKPRPATAAENSEVIRTAMRRPRLTVAPPPERRWRVVSDRGTGIVYPVTGWLFETEARRVQKERGFAHFVETWDEYVAWHRKTYPPAPRKPRPPKPKKPRP